MTLLEAAKTLLKYPNQTRERPGTCYGGTSNVYECACCRYPLNVGAREHAPACELARAKKVIEEAGEVLLAAKDTDKQHLVYEVADLS